MQLIDRHALLKNVYDNPPEKARMTQGEWCRKCIYEAPTIETEPVRHGRWIKQENGLNLCSVCGVTKVSHLPFCGHCGARMDGGNDNG